MAGDRNDRAPGPPPNGEAGGPHLAEERTIGVPAPPERPKYLVLWSGGLDSTWSLYMLLRHTDAEVYAHHVIKRSRTDDGSALSYGWLYERDAIRRMRPWLAGRVRPFAYSESAIDLTALASFARDTMTALFLGGQAAKTWRFGPGDAIVLGANADDDRLGEESDRELYWRNGFRRLLARNLLQAVMQEDRTPEVIGLVPAPTRARQVADLPAELTAMTASCRVPERVGDGDAFRPCGRCPTCVALAPHLPVYTARSDEEPDPSAADTEIASAAR